MKTSATTFAAYIRDLPSDRQSALKELRALAKKVAPEAVESIVQGMPFYELGGPLFAFAAQKHYMTLYIWDVELLASFKSRLSGLKLGKSCVCFRRIQELPLDVIQELMAAAVKRCLNSRRVN